MVCGTGMRNTDGMGYWERERGGLVGPVLYTAMHLRGFMGISLCNQSSKKSPFDEMR